MAGSRQGGRILLVAAGAGITAGAAIYRMPDANGVTLGRKTASTQRVARDVSVLSRVSPPRRGLTASS